jgi:hypothetical protein
LLCTVKCDGLARQQVERIIRKLGIEIAKGHPHIARELAGGEVSW